MAATDLTAATPGTVANFTLSATPGLCHRVELPRDLTYDIVVSVFPRAVGGVATDAKLLTVSATQAEGVAIGATEYATLPGSLWTEIRVPHDAPRTRCIFASATASQEIEIEINRAARA